MTTDSVVDAVAALLIEHARFDIKGCRCGWQELGKSHAEHVAKELDAAGLLATRAQAPEHLSNLWGAC